MADKELFKSKLKTGMRYKSYIPGLKQPKSRLEWELQQKALRKMRRQKETLAGRKRVPV